MEERAATDILDFISAIPFDLRAEVVLADIINNGYSPDDFLLHPVGLFSRRFNKDIAEAEILQIRETSSAILVKTPRDGVYDALPQALFHGAPNKSTKAFKNSTQMAEEYRRRIKEEAEARSFFSIYEFEFCRQRIANAFAELSIFDAITYRMNDPVLFEYWRMPSVFSNQQKGILFYLFPLFNKIKGSLPYMTEVYKLVLNLDIEVIKTSTRQPGAISEMTAVLSQMSLGDSSVIGFSRMPEHPVYQIILRNVPDQCIPDLLPEGKITEQIMKLNDFFVPVYAETDMAIESFEKVSLMVLGSGGNESTLGYSASLA